jgi:hypothetical protein
MRFLTAVPLTLFAVAALQGQQQAEPQGARELFYNAMVQKDPPPPAHKAPERTASPPPASGRGLTAPIVPVSTAAVHLGLRYNVVLVDDSGRYRPAAPDRIFRAGECFAIELEANRAGFLYVLAKQSSGSWKPLLPSTDPDMASESNVVTPGVKIHVPAQHCFEVQNPPGVDTLFVVLSREPRDSFEQENLTAPPKPARTAAAVEVADASIGDNAVSRMREEFGTRDIAIKKVSQPLAAAEPVGSVYVVNASLNPSSNVAAQIEIHHR